MNALRGDAAALIRLHLWQGKIPPKSPDKRPWTMSRELSIWNLLVKGRFNPDDINGAIAVMRTVRPYDGQMTLRWFYWFKKDEGFGSTPFLEQCVGYHHKGQRDDKRHKGAIPQNIKSALLDALT